MRVNLTSIKLLLSFLCSLGIAADAFAGVGPSASHGKIPSSPFAAKNERAHSMSLASSAAASVPDDSSLRVNDESAADTMDFSSRPAETVGGGGTPSPTTFREAEVLGLRLMQEGRHEDALKAFKKGLSLPGSRHDIVRTKTLQGPSPVGGGQGGKETAVVLALDEFEMQAAYYNMACACARLNNLSESVASLKKAFDNGFDNYATVRADPDLSAIHDATEFQDLMNSYDKNNGFPNPFSIFGKK